MGVAYYATGIEWRVLFSTCVVLIRYVAGRTLGPMRKAQFGASSIVIGRFMAFDGAGRCTQLRGRAGHSQ
jgi:hypothetical protein